jgi:hypothetical protein
MKSRWWGRRRAGVVLAAVLALLVVHHPLMGLMPAIGPMPTVSTAGQSMTTQAPPDAMLMGAPDATAMDGYGGACASCPDVCPMHVLAPDRSALRIVSPQTWTPIPWAGGAVPSARSARMCATSARVVRAAHSAPSAHTRRAILQVFLL